MAPKAWLEHGLETDGEVGFFQGQPVHVFFGPSGGLCIQRAFGVVALEAEHFTDAADELGEGLAGAPVVADADFGGVDVGVKHGREHAAKGGLAGVVDGEEDFSAVSLADAEVFGGGRDQGHDFELEGVAVGRISLGGDDLDVGMLREDGADAFLVGLESSQAGGGHRGLPPKIENSTAMRTTSVVWPRPTQMPIFTMAEYIAGILLMACFLLRYQKSATKPAMGAVMGSAQRMKTQKTLALADSADCSRVRRLKNSVVS